MVNPTTPPVPTSIAGLPTILSAPTASDFVPVSRNGVTYKATGAQFGTVGPPGPSGVINATSTTSNTIGTGTLTFITQASLPIVTGQYLIISDTGVPSNYVHGQVTSYNTSSGSLVMNITDVGGSGTFSAWTIASSGPQGTPGGGVTATGSPSNGNLAKFSGSGSITNGDLSGDVGTSGTLATTLKTVNATTGSFTAANITVNAKGLITAASNSGVVSGNFTLLSAQTITSSTASVSVTSGINNTYSHYIWEISNLTCTSSTVDPYITVQQGGVFLSSGYQWALMATGNGSGPTQFYDGTSAGYGNQFRIGAGSQIVTTAQSVSLVFEFWKPDIANNLNVAFKSTYGDVTFIIGAGSVNTSAATTGIKLAMSSGNIATLQANLYGIT